MVLINKKPRITLHFYISKTSSAVVKSWGYKSYEHTFPARFVNLVILLLRQSDGRRDNTIGFDINKRNTLK